MPWPDEALQGAIVLFQAQHLVSSCSRGGRQGTDDDEGEESGDIICVSDNDVFMFAIVSFGKEEDARAFVSEPSFADMGKDEDFIL